MASETANEPKTAFLPNGEEWTLDLPLVEVGDGLFDYADENEKRIIGHIVGQRVIRFKKAQLEAFKKSEAKSEEAFEKHFSQTTTWFMLTLLVCVIWAGSAAVYLGAKGISHIYMMTAALLPPMIFMSIFLFQIFPARKKIAWGFREEAAEFQAAILKQYYSDLELKDIGDCLLLPERGPSRDDEFPGECNGRID